MAWLLARHGERWGLHGVADVAALPLLAAVFTVFFFVATPITNTMVRVQDIEADRFGLNLAREPHGEAEVDLKLTEYRKPDPGPVEEFVFFDHPSTRFACTMRCDALARGDGELALTRLRAAGRTPSTVPALRRRPCRWRPWARRT